MTHICAKSGEDCIEFFIIHTRDASSMVKGGANNFSKHPPSREYNPGHVPVSLYVQG